MGQYIPPLRDMQFVPHEKLKVEQRLRKLPAHAHIDAATIRREVRCAVYAERRAQYRESRIAQ